MTISYYQYAEIMFQQKGLAPDKKLLRKAKRALKVAYEKTTYTAVALDVDGTLTQEHSTKVTREMAIAVLNLAKRGIPVLLITGRGRSSTKDAMKQIIEYSLPSNYGWISLISAITHNGVLLLQSQKPMLSDISTITSNEYLLSEEIRLKEPSPKLKDYYEKLLKREEFRDGLANGLVSIKLEPTYDLPPNGIRIAIRGNYSSLCDVARSALNDVKENIGDSEQFTLSHGWFGDYCVFDLFNTNKVEGLKVFADMMMIPLDEILRIGDQGDEEGNDYGFLNSSRGFSVGTLSKSYDKCFPVISDDGERLTGSKAVNELLRKVRILPPLSLRTTTISRNKWTKKHHDDVLKKMLWFEYNASKRANEEKEFLFWNVKNTIKRLLSTSGVKLDLTSLNYNDIFEDLNGGIRIYNWELLEINENHPFRLLFGLTHEFLCCPYVVNFKWAMPTDVGILLRGPHYYWMMMHCDDCHPMDTSYLDMYYLVSINFIQSSIEAIKEEQNIREPKLVTYKLLLGILDNVRNIIIQWWYAVYLLSSVVQLETEKTNIRSFLEDFFEKVFYVHTKFFIRTLTGTGLVGWNRLLATYTDILADVGHYIEKARDLSKITVSELSSEKITLVKPLIRKWREVDDFLEAVLAVEIGLTEIRHLIETSWPELEGDFSIVTLGLAYGGIELPAIAYALAENLDIDVIPGFALMSFYSNQEIRVRTLTNTIPEEYFEKKKRESFIPSLFFIGKRDHFAQKNIPVVIMDDNCTTVRTLSFARKWLVEEGYIVPGSIIVRYPGINRFLQMLLPNHGTPNPDMLLSFIRGLVSPSPYSRLVRDVNKEAFHNEIEDKKIYLDCTGIFDLSRDKTKRSLIKSQMELNVKICDIKDVHMARFCGRIGVDMIGIHAIYDINPNSLNIFMRLTNEINMYFPHTKVVLVTKIRDAEKLRNIISLVDIRVIQIYVFNENDVNKINNLEQEEDMQGQAVREILTKVTSVINDLKEYERRYLSGVNPIQFIITLPVMGIPTKYIKFSIEQMLPYADYFLFDTSARGGTGILADPVRLRELLSYTKGIKTFIAGGLNPNNIEDVLNTLLPYEPFGVDVQTGVETTDPLETKRKRLKSPSKIIRFVSTVQGISDSLNAGKKNPNKVSNKLLVRARKRKTIEKPYLVAWAITDFPINDPKQMDYWKTMRKTDIDALHIDWSDGTLTPKFVRNNFNDVKKLLNAHNIPGINYELHLMVKKNSSWVHIIESMLDINPLLNLVYFHFYPNVQYVDGLNNISSFLRGYGINIGIAVETRFLEIFIKNWAADVVSAIGSSVIDFSIVTRKYSHGDFSKSLEKDKEEIARVVEEIEKLISDNNTYLSLDRNIVTEKLQEISSIRTKNKDGNLFNKVIVGGEITNSLKEMQNLDIWERAERIQGQIDRYRGLLQQS